jgi:alanine racemase
VTSPAGLSLLGVGVVPPPALEPLPEAIVRNVAIARSRTRSRIMAVVKADGYGHGAIAVAHAAVAAGAEWLGTTDIAEASRLRAAGLTVPILTWLNPSGVDAEAAAINQIDIAIGSVDELVALLTHAASCVRVHLNVDTGMAREVVRRTNGTR